MAAHPNLAIRRADIGKWNNAAAAQATHLGAQALPYIRVYDAHGKVIRHDLFRSHYIPDSPTTVYGPGRTPPGPYIVLPKSV